MAGDVADGAGAEVPPAAPGERVVVLGVVGPLRRRAEPEIPLDVVGHVVDFLGAPHRLRPDRPIRPVLDPVHFADHAGFDPLADEARTLGCVALVAHLGRRAGLAGRLADHPRLADGARQRLLGEDVQAAFERGHGDHGVRVVGGRDEHRVKVVVGVEHLAVVVVPLRVRMCVHRLFGALPVDVAERHDVLAGDAGDIAPAFAAGAHGCDVQLVAGRLFAAPEDVAGNDHPAGAGGCGAEHAAAAQVLFGHGEVAFLDQGLCAVG